MILIFVAQRLINPFLSMEWTSLISSLDKLRSLQGNNLVPFPMILGSYCDLFYRPSSQHHFISVLQSLWQKSHQGCKRSFTTGHWTPRQDSFSRLWIYRFAVVELPFVRSVFGWNWFRDFVRDFRSLCVMIPLPTVTFMTTDSLRAVPRRYREASLAIGPLAGKPSGVWQQQHVQVFSLQWSLGWRVPSARSPCYSGSLSETQQLSQRN